MSPALNRSSAIWCFECANAIEIHSKVVYMGLPQYLTLMWLCVQWFYRCVPAGALTRRCMNNICEEKNTSGYELVV